MEINFRIVGSTALRIGDRFVSGWAQPKPRGLLAALLLHPDQPVTVDELVGWMWPAGRIPDKPVDTLYTYAKRIREALERMARPPRIHVAGGTYRIEADRAEIDFFRFKALLETAASQRQQGDQQAATRSLGAALELWPGQPLADLTGDRAEEWRGLTEQELVIPAHAELLSGLCSAGKFDEVLRRLSDLPIEYRSNLALIKCRLRALRGAHQYPQATSYYMGQRRRMLAEFDQESADELTRYHNELSRRHEVVAEPLSTAPRLLPHDIADFTGREDLLDQLDNMIETPTVTVLVGEPGVGKTALAVRWAHRSASDFPSRLYVDMNGFSAEARLEPAEVVARFLDALGYPADRIPSLPARLSRLRTLLAGTRCLVILDNAGDAAHVRSLLDCLSACVVVVTSRRRLQGLRATTIPVAPLSYVDAKALLTNRIGARALSEPGAVGEIAALCGGIAMAVRLAAEHIVGRPRIALVEFAAEFRDARTLLGLGDDGYGLDGSVRGAFGHSYQRLGESEQRLFRLLGVNPGTDISSEAATALSGLGNRQTRLSLDTLVDAHLMTQPESLRRYRFHDLIKKYAHERAEMARPEGIAAAERLLSYYLHTTSNADMLVFPGRDEVPPLPLVKGVVATTFPDADSATRWIVRERANISALVRYAADNGFHDYATRLPSSVGEIFTRLGHHDDAIAVLEVAVRSAIRVADVDREAASLGNLGFIYLTLHDLVQAERYLRPAKVKCDEAGDIRGSAVNEHLLGRLLVERGDYKQGIETQLASLERLRKLDARGETVIALYRLGEAYRRAGNFDAAVSYCMASLASAREIGDRRSEVMMMIELALTHYGRGDLRAAKDACDRGLALSAEIHETTQLGRYHVLLASISRDQGKIRQAEHFARIALARSRGARDIRTEAVAGDLLAELLYMQARNEEAINAWARAMAIFEDLGDARAGSVRARLEESAAFPNLIPVERTEPLPGQRASRHSGAEDPGKPPTI